MDLGLRGRVCVVTGSTGGIGLETARLLAAEGARVVVCGRDSARVDAAREETRGAPGIVVDLTEPGAPEELVHSARGRGSVSPHPRVGGGWWVRLRSAAPPPPGGGGGRGWRPPQRLRLHVM